MENKTLVIACKQFFGIKEGQSLKDFSAEMKMLTAKDREDFRIEFEKIGIHITDGPFVS